MYLTFYGLKKEPFHTTPDPNFLYLSPTHKEALGAIIYGIEQRKGFIAITGDVGVGKTTIIRAYLERPTTRKQKTIYIFNPVVSFQALLNTIFRSLDVTPTQTDLPDMVTQLHEILIAEYRANSTVVLVIDEAQNMPVETLENLRMLSNLETASDKLIQIVLIGQPELHALLDDPKLKALKQRIALRANICPLTAQESQAYIEHRVNLASRTGHPLFTRDAIKLITQQAQGVPRRLNILCDNALITGYGRQRNPVTASEVKEILADFDGKRSAELWKWPYVAIIAIALLIGSLFLVSSFLPTNTRVFESSMGKSAQSTFTGQGKTFNQEPLSDQAEESSPTLTAQQSSDSSTGPIQNVISSRERARSETGDPIDAFRTAEQEFTETSKSNQAVLLEPQSPNISKNDLSLTISEQNTESNLMPDRVEAQPVTRRENKVLKTDQQIFFKEELSANEKPHQLLPRTRFVKKGENLSKIAQEVYGSDDPKYVNWVRNHNTSITDPDLILPGQQIIIPEYVKE